MHKKNFQSVGTILLQARKKNFKDSSELKILGTISQARKKFQLLKKKPGNLKKRIQNRRKILQSSNRLLDSRITAKDDRH